MTPVHMALAYPTRIETSTAFNGDIGITFHGSNGDKLSVRMTNRQATDMIHGDNPFAQKRTQVDLATDLYLEGKIDITELERRLDLVRQSGEPDGLD